MSSEEPESPWRTLLASVRFQFSLRTLFILTAVVALLVGMTVWLGVAAWVFGVILVAAGAGAFVGLIVGQQLGLDTAIDDARWEALRCLLLAVVLVVPAWLLIHFAIATVAARVLILPVLVHGVCLKLAWLDFGPAEVAVVELSTLAGVGLAGGLLLSVAGWM